MKTMLVAVALGLLGTAYGNTEVKKVRTGLTTEKLEVKSETLNSLIRGELAAVETYDSALENLKGTEEKRKLQTIRDTHQDTADKLKEFVVKNEKKEVKDSGVWGDFAKVYEDGAAILGNKSAVQALSQGEEHGLRTMQTALKDQKLPEEIRKMIKTQLIPNQERNIKTLKGFI